MYRKQIKYLNDWKNREDFKPLIMRGARQVGKTFLVRDFGAEYFDNYIEINFDETPEKIEYFKNNNIEDIILMLETDSGKKIVDGKTLLFFDEIQVAPELFHKLRYFYERRPNLHIISAGSLLDFLLEDHQFSMPVGRVEYMFLGPMTYSEFLLANDEKALFEYLENYDLSKTIPTPIHDKFIKYFNLFLLVGGMPKAINGFIKTNGKLNNTNREHRNIVQSYIDDLSKYSKKIDSTIVKDIFQKTPKFIGERIKYKNFNSDLRSTVAKHAIHLLSLAKVIQPIYHTASNGVPLGAEKKEKDFKLLFLDVGLMSSALGLKLNELYLMDNIMTINKGDICEQFIGQHLLYLKEPYIEPELYFWHRQEKNATAELDFIHSINSKVIPIEVKSGKTGTLKSLHMFTKMKESEIAVRFNTERPSLFESEKTKILSLPLYMVEQMERLINLN